MVVGSRVVRRRVLHDSLDMGISVGECVRSRIAPQFRMVMAMRDALADGRRGDRLHALGPRNVLSNPSMEGRAL